MNKAIIIGGPTASGKSKFALELAKALDGEIVNADSVQCYKDVATLASAPSSEDLEICPHHLYGYKSYHENSSVGLWLDEVRPVINTISKHGKLPIIVGGTGLYINALLEGLAQIPESSDEARESIRAILEQKGLDDLYEKLMELDPDAANNISPSDTQRIQRALEVYLTTGHKLSRWHNYNSTPLLEDYQVEVIVLHPERKLLRNLCDTRFIELLDLGAIGEVEFLMNQDIPRESQVTKAIGYQEIEEYLLGDKTLNNAISQAQTKTKQYAKRQLTWFRNRLPQQKTFYFSTENEFNEHVKLYLENNSKYYL